MSNGLFTNSKLVESLITDLNNLSKALMTGQYIQFCNIVTQMGQKLANLRTGIVADLDSKDRVIESLKQIIRNNGEEVTDMSIEEYMKNHRPKDGAKNGEN